MSTWSLIPSTSCPGPRTADTLAPAAAVARADDGPDGNVPDYLRRRGGLGRVCWSVQYPVGNHRGAGQEASSPLEAWSWRAKS